MLPHTLIGIDPDAHDGLEALLFDALVGVTGERFDSDVCRQIAEKGMVFPTIIVGGH